MGLVMGLSTTAGEKEKMMLGGGGRGGSKKNKQPRKEKETDAPIMIIWPSSSVPFTAASPSPTRLMI